MEKRAHPGLPWLLFVAVLVLGAYARFRGLEAVGIGGHDNFDYWRWGLEWARGGRDLHGFFRPVAYWFYGLAFQVFGVHDHSIKLLNAGLDTLNIVLTFAMALAASRSAWVALNCSFFYAFARIIVKFSRQELLHTLSTTFVLSCCLGFLVFMSLEGRRAHPAARLPVLILSGIMLGLAALVHTDLALAGPAFVAMLGLLILADPPDGPVPGRHVFPAPAPKAMDRLPRLPRFLIQAGTFTAAFFAPLAVSFGLYGLTPFLNDVFGSLTRSRAMAEMSAPAGLVAAYKNFIHYPAGIDPAAILYLGIPVFMLWRLRQGRSILPDDRFVTRFAWLPLVLAATYVPLYALCRFKLLPRLFIPFAPVILYGLFFWYGRMFYIMRERLRAPAWLPPALLVAFLCVFARPWQVFTERYVTPTGYREISNVIGPMVNRDNRLLFVHYLVHDLRGVGFHPELYFESDHCDYLWDYGKTPLLKAMQDRKVRFVALVNDSLEQVNLVRLKETLGATYGWKPEEYDEDKDELFLRQFLAEQGAVKIFASPRAEIWDVRPAHGQ